MVEDHLINTIKTMANGKAERCGVITESGELIEITNVSNDPNKFLFSRKEWCSLLNQKINIKVIWHTHVNGTSDPSEADLEFMRTVQYDSLIVSSSSWRYIECLEK